MVILDSYLIILAEDDIEDEGERVNCHLLAVNLRDLSIQQVQFEWDGERYGYDRFYDSYFTLKKYNENTIIVLEEKRCLQMIIIESFQRKTDRVLIPF